MLKPSETIRLGWMLLVCFAVGDAARSSERSPDEPPQSFAALAAGFTCVETVSVDVTSGQQTERIHRGSADYLLIRPRRKKEQPHRFREKRTPRPKQAPWNQLPQPVPLTWMTLNPSAGTKACASEEGACTEFVGTQEFGDGLDPRGWSGRLWRDDADRLSRLEVVPSNQGPRLDRVVTRGPAGGLPGVPGAPGAAELPTMRIDGAVEDIRCEIEFGEMIPGWWLPRQSVCHRETVTLRGKVKKRWTLLREFSRCRQFGVTTIETVEPPSSENR